ncbi:MAG: HEAT repeat domain-containing protein [Gemmatimonadales bacterium]
MTGQREFPELDPRRETNALLRSMSQLSDDHEREATPLMAALLHHGDPDVRQEALRKLTVHWKNPGYRQAARDAVANDPDEGVRATAAFGIASLSTKETAVDDTSLLLPVVRAEHLGPELRISAYEALLLLHGRRDLPPLDPVVDPRAAIDWDWIGSLTR